MGPRQTPTDRNRMKSRQTPTNPKRMESCRTPTNPNRMGSRQKCHDRDRIILYGSDNPT